MVSLSDLKIKIFADGADTKGIFEMYQNPLIKGFTTNPTLMRKAGVADYQSFAREVLKIVKDKPISFEVLSDDFNEMERQAHKIAEWGTNVYVKIPVINTRNEFMTDLIKKLNRAGVKVNVTAMMTFEQVLKVTGALDGGTSACISIFAGRIADTGRDPNPLMASVVEYLKNYPNIELIWASPRELLNIFQANSIGCHIITVTNDILEKITQVGKDLDLFSLETVKMFYEDAQNAGYSLS